MHVDLDGAGFGAVVVFGSVVVIAPARGKLADSTAHASVFLLEVPRRGAGARVRELAIEMARLVAIARAVRRQLGGKAVHVDPKVVLARDEADRLVEPRPVLGAQIALSRFEVRHPDLAFRRDLDLSRNQSISQ